MRSQFVTKFQVCKVQPDGTIQVLEEWYDRQTALIDAQSKGAFVRAKLVEEFLPLSDRTK